jgi:hypothetical protein
MEHPVFYVALVPGPRRIYRVSLAGRIMDDEPWIALLRILFVKTMDDFCRVRS